MVICLFIASTICYSFTLSQDSFNMYLKITIMNFLTDISAVTARKRWTQLKAYQDYVIKLVIKKLIDREPTLLKVQGK